MRFIHENLYPLIAALIIIAASTCWFEAPEPTPPRILATVAEPWSLPKLAEHDNKKYIDAINTRNLWGVVATDAPKAPEWHVLGIARSGADRFVLLAYDGKPVETLKVGDTLPDGTKILKIEDDRFFVMTADKKKLAFGMYKNDPEK